MLGHLSQVDNPHPKTSMLPSSARLAAPRRCRSCRRPAGLNRSAATGPLYDMGARQGTCCDRLATREGCLAHVRSSRHEGRHHFSTRCLRANVARPDRRPPADRSRAQSYRLPTSSTGACRCASIGPSVHFQIEPTIEEIQWALRFPPDTRLACARYIAEAIERVVEQSRVIEPVSAVPNAIDLDSFGPG
jgi:hypothetical protein